MGGGWCGEKRRKVWRFWRVGGGLVGRHFVLRRDNADRQSSLVLVSLDKGCFWDARTRRARKSIKGGAC